MENLFSEIENSLQTRFVLFEKFQKIKIISYSSWRIEHHDELVVAFNLNGYTRQTKHPTMNALGYKFHQFTISRKESIGLMQYISMNKINNFRDANLAIVNYVLKKYSIAHSPEVIYEINEFKNGSKRVNLFIKSKTKK